MVKDENILDNYLVKLITEEKYHAWAGDNPPFPMDTFDLHGSTNYRLSPSMHGKYDVVWFLQVTPNSFFEGDSWKIAMDESIRLLKERGKLVLKVDKINNKQKLCFPAVKAFLGRHIGIECDTLYETQKDDWSSCIIVFSIRRRQYEIYQSRLWSFGILTLGDKVERVCSFLSSIRKYDQNREHEILIYGPKNSAYDEYGVTYVEDTENLLLSAYPEISKKKNRIIDMARHPNLMLVHDRYALGDDFFSGFEKYGYDFDFLTVKQYDTEGREFPSYSALKHKMLWSTCIQCNNYSNLYDSQYLNGGLLIMKTAIARKIRFNTCLFWGEMEDVELSKVCMEQSIVPRINFLSSTNVLHVKPEYLIPWVMDDVEVPENVARKESHFAINDLIEEVVRHTPQKEDDVYYGVTDNRYLFPWHLCKRGERIVIYGAGDVGKCFVGQVRRYNFVKLVGVVDKNWKRIQVRDMVVDSPDRLREWNYEGIIISVKDHILYQSIEKNLEHLGVPNGKIRWDGTCYDRDVFLRERYFKKILCEETFQKRRLLIETTQISLNDVGSGIQRLVNELYQQLYTNDKYEIIPVVVDEDGKLHRSEKFGKNMKNEKAIELRVGDKILFADVSWAYLTRMEKLFKKAAERKTDIYVIIYDLIPIREQETVDENFASWIRMVLKKSKAVIGITETVANDVAMYYQEEEIKRAVPLLLYTCHLGYDIKTKSNGVVRSKLLDFLSNKETFLMVGTVGHRKQQDMVVRTFRRMWESGKLLSKRLLIIGHVLDENDAEPLRKLLNEDFVGKENILWLEDASDAELKYSYKKARTLLQASLSEGFGLPLVEGIHYGLSILCSDLPVFHEVTEGNAQFFRTGDTYSLQKALESWDKKKNIHSSKTKIYSWKDTSQEFMDIMEESKKLYKILY